MAFGDGNGSPVIPTVNQSGLVHETYRVGVDSVTRDSTNTNWVIIQATIPAAAGPFTIREAGVYLQDGTFFAVSNFPDTYKSVPSEGAFADVTVQLIVVVTDTAQVAISVDSATGASQEFVNTAIKNWIVPLSQLLRAPFIAVNSVTTAAPPGAPTLGDIYGIPASATGLWSGKDGQFAQFVGIGANYLNVDAGGWVYKTAQRRTIVGAQDSGFYYERRGDGSEPLWRLMWASDDECIAGVLTDKWVNPHGLKAAIASFSGVESYNQIFPEILTSNSKFSLTSGSGQVVLGAGQSFTHRGARAYSTDVFSLGQRTLVTQANKTYHGRIRMTAGQTPVLTWCDIADTAVYNPTSKVEADSAFDTTFDDMLFCRVVTNGSNVATVTPLVNKHRLFVRSVTGFTLSVGRTTNSSGAWCYVFAPITTDWSRTPDAFAVGSRGGYGTEMAHIPEETWTMIYAADDDGNRGDATGNPLPKTDRYSANVKIWVDTNYPSVFISFNPTLRFQAQA
jgi:hypothetical protein